MHCISYGFLMGYNTRRYIYIHPLGLPDGELHLSGGEGGGVVVDEVG